MNLADVSSNSTIEDIVETYPEAVVFLLERYNIRVICCGAPIWATIAELAQKASIAPEKLATELREFLQAQRAAS